MFLVHTRSHLFIFFPYLFILSRFINYMYWTTICLYLKSNGHSWSNELHYTEYACTVHPYSWQKSLKDNLWCNFQWLDQEGCVNRLIHCGGRVGVFAAYIITCTVTVCIKGVSIANRLLLRTNMFMKLRSNIFKASKTSLSTKHEYGRIFGLTQSLWFLTKHKFNDFCILWQCSKVNSNANYHFHIVYWPENDIIHGLHCIGTAHL